MFHVYNLPDHPVPDFFDWSELHLHPGTQFALVVTDADIVETMMERWTNGLRSRGIYVEWEEPEHRLYVVEHSQVFKYGLSLEDRGHWLYGTVIARRIPTKWVTVLDEIRALEKEGVYNAGQRL